VSANGLRKVAEGKVNPPKCERSIVLGRLTRKDGSPKGAEEGDSQSSRRK